MATRSRPRRGGGGGGGEGGYRSRGPPRGGPRRPYRRPPPSREFKGGLSSVLYWYASLMRGLLFVPLYRMFRVNIGTNTIKKAGISECLSHPDLL